MRISHLTLLAVLIPVHALADGSSFKTDFRLIDFDRDRAVCVEAGAHLYTDPEGSVVRHVDQSRDLRASAISLDQDWVQVELEEQNFLVRPNHLSFGAC